MSGESKKAKHPTVQAFLREHGRGEAQELVNVSFTNCPECGEPVTSGSFACGHNPHATPSVPQEKREQYFEFVPRTDTDGPCRMCGRAVECWFADNALWNSVNGGATGLLCIACFVAKAEEAGINKAAWHIELDPASAGLPTLPAEGSAVERPKLEQFGTTTSATKGEAYVYVDIQDEKDALISSLRAQLDIWGSNAPCPECGEIHQCGTQSQLAAATAKADTLRGELEMLRKEHLFGALYDGLKQAQRERDEARGRSAAHAITIGRLKANLAALGVGGGEVALPECVVLPEDQGALLLKCSDGRAKTLDSVLLELCVRERHVRERVTANRVLDGRVAELEASLPQIVEFVRGWGRGPEPGKCTHQMEQSCEQFGCSSFIDLAEDIQNKFGAALTTPPAPAEKEGR